MSNSILRKVDSENRAFKSEWEHDYFFILNKDHKQQCLVCFQVLAVLKEYNLKRHYTTNHKQKFGKHSCESRKVVCDQLKKKLFQQKSLFTNETKQQEEALLASYFVTYELMKAKKALSDGELIKNCAIKMAEAFNENKVGNKFQTVPLSKQTVTRRLEDISNQISNNVKDIIANCSYSAIALDESIDVSDTNQLLLRHEIATFLREEVANSAELQKDFEDVELLRNLAFLTNITQHLNVLNLQLQGKKQTICQMVGFVDSFHKKLHLFKSALDKNNLLHFPCCRKLSEEEEGLEFRDYTEIIEDLSSEFDRRFNDFESFRPDISLFSNPIHCDIESQPGHLQLELCELQCDPSLNTSQVTGIDFWKLLSPERYPLLRNWALKLCSVFASTYICETAFSSLKHVKSKNRNRLSDVVLSHILRVATSQLEVDFISLVSSFMKPQCSH
ncbi:hypothetical protein B7P43_G08380 [Cryptotermes secundus]|uniref:HAT C-terminal dimerisation domain-containing protein n=1 Tax=Cryptotermes secundus TaxID=105785 RepID=A0A2J7Q4E3_9NEOP|nr:hypothetical protein B7P43_G08380 [Cryptotermes secundus]